MTNTRPVHRVDNFGAGPSALPLPVLERAQEELLDFSGSGMSMLELSHRDRRYEAVYHRAVQRLRELLGLSAQQQVLFLQGGASLQFAMVPMNLLTPDRSTAAYVNSGAWATKAYQDASAIGDVRIIANSQETAFDRIPPVSVDDLRPSDAYLHVTSNETIGGVQWPSLPADMPVPVVVDMSSDILSRTVDVTRLALIYAGAQKNLGPSGVVVVIVQDEVLAHSSDRVPSILHYATHAANESRYNTPPTFSVYLMGLVLDWVAEQGGVSAVSACSEEKAARLYAVIDGCGDFYRGHALPAHRSRMNVTFRLPDERLEQAFVAQAEAAGLVGLAGHRSVGGCRASLYNAVTLAACDRLATFMQDFARTHG